jgi:hypothetical protein
VAWWNESLFFLFLFCAGLDLTKLFCWSGLGRAEISSITGLQQQIKAAFGRWRKRGTPSSPSSSSAFEEEVGSGGGPIREDCFDHPLNVRLSAQSQTFSHPHRLTVFPPFPSGSGASPSSSSANVSPARTNKSSAFATSSSASPSNPTGSGGSSSKSSGGSHPFSFVRGLRKRRAGREGSESTSHQQHRNLSDLCSDRIRSRTAGDSGWPNCSSRLGGGQDHFGSFGPLTSKSRSDHSLHRILKEDNTWTVFATLRPPSGSSHPTTIFICV